jgi:hypothetical protein
MSKLIYPVFGHLKKKAGTTLIHATSDEVRTLCGRNCEEYYGDDELGISDIECKNCRKLLPRGSFVETEKDCPKCGKPTLEISRYKKWGKPPVPARSFIHKKELRQGPIPHYLITESCLVKGEFE